MDFTISAHEEDGCLRLGLAGKLASDLPRALDQCVRLAAIAYPSGHTRFLVDARAMESRPSTLTSFAFATLTCPEEPDSFRRAVVELPEHAPAAESPLHSPGRCQRIFFDEDAALAWLLSNEP